MITGSAKESGSVSEGSASSSSEVSLPSESSGSSASSSSCTCDWEVTEITLTSEMTGSYLITNTGCGDVIFVAHFPTPEDFEVGDFTLSPGESTTVLIESAEDIRLTSFTVLTDCSEKSYQWPDFP